MLRYKKTTPKNQISQHSSAIFTIICLYLVMEAFGITCPIRFLTGISCAGCGMSRAFLCVLRFDFKTAFYYHPLFEIVIPVGLCIFFQEYIRPQFFKLILSLSVFAFLLVYIIRLLSPDQTIVAFQPGEGFIFRMFCQFVA